MANFLDLCRFIPTAGGTADFTFNVAVAGYQSPMTAGVINGESYKYRAENISLSEWEIGECTYDTSTGVLRRNTVIYNSLGTTAKINFSLPPQVAFVALKDDLLSLDKKNYIINGAMTVSQEWGSQALTVSGYPVDHFLVSRNGGGAYTAQQVYSPTPEGSPNRIRIVCTVADPSLDATDYIFIIHGMEGYHVADLLMGTPQAKTVTLRFGCRGPAGTYCVSLQDVSALTRSYITDFVISPSEANIDVVKKIIFQLDTGGANWVKDNRGSLRINWQLACGTTFRNITNTWINGNFIASSNISNFMAITGNTFELFDVGMYEGTIAPEYKIPDFNRTVHICKRYFESGRGELQYMGLQIGAFYKGYSFVVEKRTTPTMSFSGMLYYSSSGALAGWNPQLHQVSPYKFEYTLGGANIGVHHGGFWKANARVMG
jgi:hypothetical protein